jgi:hypothetical protein
MSTFLSELEKIIREVFPEKNVVYTAVEEDPGISGIWNIRIVGKYGGYCKSIEFAWDNSDPFQESMLYDPPKIRLLIGRDFSTLEIYKNTPDPYQGESLKELVRKVLLNDEDIRWISRIKGI